MEEVNEQNDNAMILVVVEDDDCTKKCETRVKIEPIDDVKGLYCTENIRQIFPIAVEHTEISEVQPDIEVLKMGKTESTAPQKKRAPRKTRHEYLIDETEYLIQSNISSKKRKRKPKVSARKHTPKKKPVSDEEDFYEIEFLEDDINSPENDFNKTSEEDFQEIEFLDVSSKTYSPKKKNKTSISDEEFLESKKNRKIKDPPKKRVRKTEEDEEYLPKKKVQEELIKEEYVRPKRKKKPTISSRSPDPKIPLQAPKKGNRKTNITLKKTSTLSRKHTQKPTKKAKKIKRPIKSLIAELRKKQPLFKDNEEELLEYLADLMKKRKPAPPLPNSYLLNEDNEYSCSYCDVENPTESTARRHYQYSHGPRFLECYACGDDFRSGQMLFKHQKRCRAPDAAIQLRARGVFLASRDKGRPYHKNKFTLTDPPMEKQTEPVHMLPADTTKFYCPQCPAVYDKHSLLKEHMHKHTGFRPFQCHECPATYISRHQLSSHLKKHRKEQFVCDYCGKGLKKKSSLISHISTHLTRLRFGCGRCGRRYAKRGEMLAHIMREHMNLPPPAACPVCPKRYNRMSHVKSHMKRDHGLILMTRNAIMRNLPNMKLEELKGAKIVFNSEYSEKVVSLNPEEVPT